MPNVNIGFQRPMQASTELTPSKFSGFVFLGSGTIKLQLQLNMSFWLILA